MHRAGPVSLALIQFLCVYFLIAAHTTASKAAPLSVVHAANDLWSSLATRAAKETIAAVRKTMKTELELQTVPMETFQVLVGRQHHLGLEVDGVTYDLLLGNEEEALEQARRRAAAAPAAAASPADASADPSTAVAAAAARTLPAGITAAAAAALSASPAADAVTALSTSSGSREVAPLQLFSGPRSSRTLELPETTLSGPLELLLPVPEPLSIYSPLAADVGGPVRRVLIESGVTVRVAGLRRLSLRRPLELSRLPGQYLAEVWAQAATGEAEDGFQTAPGIVYLAEQLRKAAVAAANSTAGASGSSGGRGGKQGGGGGGGGGPQSALLSLEVETVAAGALTITSALELPPPYARAAAAPRLKIRRLAGATVELSLRQGQLTAADTFNPAALSRVWAWPLPHIDSSSWLPYETLLRSVLASHPFNIDSVIRRGIGLRLTKSSIQGVHLIAFDMEVRAVRPRPPELEDSPYAWNEKPLEIWEAVVQVKPRSATSPTQPSDGSGTSSSSSAAAAAEGFRFVPLHVMRKQSHQNTVTMSRSAMIMALTGGLNVTVPGADGDGYDQTEMGLAANAP